MELRFKLHRPAHEQHPPPSDLTLRPPAQFVRAQHTSTPTLKSMVTAAKASIRLRPHCGATSAPRPSGGRTPPPKGTPANGGEGLRGRARANWFHPVNIPTRPSPNTMRIFLKPVATRRCE